MLHKAGFSGCSGVKFHNYNGSKDCSFRLNLQDYNVRIIDPAPVTLYKNGKLETVNAITNAQFTDPGSVNANYTTAATFYRYDTTSIKAVIDSKYGTASLKGIYICNPDNYSQHSSLITLSGGSFTFSPQIINNYSSYIKNNKFVIQPVYEFDKISFNVESYTDSDTGVTFTADNANHTGTFSIDGKPYGTVSWSCDSSRKGAYYDGDELVFTFTPTGTGVTKTVAYEYRFANVESDLASTQWYKTGTAAENVSITLSHKYFSVSPYITDLTVKNQLRVVNPDKGDFTSKGTKYAASNTDGSVTVTGYYIKGSGSTQTIDESFVSYKPGMRMEYTAKPDSGWFAVWTYTDTVTHQEKTYYGNTFYYTVQNPFRYNDNTVTLEFYSSALTIYSPVSAPLYGSIYVPDGTILHPSTASTDVKIPAANATVYMDGYVGVTDENGSFVLKESAESDAPARIFALGKRDASISYSNKYKVDEVHRALVYYNGNHYVCDIKLSGDADKITAFNTELLLDTSSTLGVIPKHAEAFSYDTGTYGDTITLVNARMVNFSVDFDARNISSSKPVNLARWSFESKDGMIRSSTDIPVISGSSTASYSCVITEKAKPGDRMFIEFYNKSYDSSSNEKLTFYGKYEVGYNFVSANIDKVMSYMPDIGFYDEEGPSESGADIVSSGAHYAKTPSAPAIGPISPMVSIFGFLPTFSDAATGQKDQKTGKDLYCLEIGVQLSISRSDTAEKQGSWGAASVAKQWDKLSKLLSDKPGDPIQNMHTSTKISVTISFAYQLEYYTSDSGQRCYTASVFLLGGKLGVKVSVPFTIVAIPCFVYFDISADNVGYLVHMPNERTDGYWNAEMLDNSYYYDTHGEFSQNFKIQMGVGIGFDGLASIGGHIDFGLKSQISGTSHGKMTVSVSGGVFAQLLFFKVDQTWKIKDKVLLDTDANLAAVGANILDREGGDLFADTKLSDLTFAEAEDIYDDTVYDGKDIAMTGADGDGYAIYTNENYAEENTAQMTPVIGKISDTKHLIATVMNTENQKFALRYFIYDSETDEIDKKGSPVTAVIADNGLALDDDRVQALLDCEDLVGDVNVIDCGDKLLLVWEGCTVEDYTTAAVDDALRSFKIAAVVYDKKNDVFTGFDIVDTESNSLPDQLKGTYDPSTGMTYVFYESADASGFNPDTTLAQLNEQPLSLNVCSIDLSGEHPRFNKPVKLETQGNTISDYDVCTYDGDVLLSYISTGKNTLTVEKPLTSGEYDTNSFGTQNRMYLNRYSGSDTGALNRVSSVLIADEDYVTANPEFTQLSFNGDVNTLLFYKCNGRYGYQNIENLYIQYRHEGWDETGALKGDAMQPQYITDDEDHTVGEDFKVYAGEDGCLYALWTLSEGSQQQIWGRQFSVDSVEEISEVAATDEDKNVLFASADNPVTKKLDKPIHILHGFWGNKAQLTVGGFKDENGATDTGFYKGKFDAVVLDKDNILSAYSSFDYDFGEEEEGTEIKAINNRFIIAEYDIRPYFYLGSKYYEDAVKVDNELPTPGETVKITTFAVNSGFSTTKDVTLKLMALGGIEIGEVTYPVWLSGEEKETVFEYTVPENADLSGDGMGLFYEIYDKGDKERKYRSEITAALKSAPRLSIDIAHAEPQQYITDENDTTSYRVTATVSNIGNAPYTGGDELTFIYNDMAAQADVMNKNVADTKPFYINYGGIVIPEIGVGSSVELSFVSSDIPESIFDEYGTNSANLKLAITPEDGIGWTQVKGEEPYNFHDELGIGQFVKPVPVEITDISAKDVSVPKGSVAFIVPSVTPAAAASYAKLQFRSADEKIVSVDENGVVTGMKEGSTTVTVSCGEISKTINVTVTFAEGMLLGDVDGDGEVTVIDATYIQRKLASVPISFEFNDEVADTDEDKKVTILDATYIQKWLASLPSNDHIGKRIT